MNSPKSSKSKLDAALGISPDKSIDDFLESLTVENDSAKDAVQKIDTTVKNEVETIDKAISCISSGTAQDESERLLSLVKIDDSLKSIDELINISKEVIKHVYENIACTELVDSEMIHAAAAFIESCHLNIKEYIDLYKDRLKFFDKVKFEMLQQKHKKELIEYKHKLDMEKLDASKPTEIVPADMKSYSQEDIVAALKDQTI